MTIKKKTVGYLIISTGFGLDRFIYSILPELEADEHHSDVAGICFFDENAQVLNLKEPVGQRLINMAKEKNITLMIAEKCDLTAKVAGDGIDLEKHLSPAECPVIIITEGHQVACFPDVYAALGNRRPEYLLSL